MTLPNEMRRFGPTGEWLDRNEAVVTVGLTQETVADIGDISFVSLPELFSTLVAGEVAFVIESSKAAIDCETPLSGTVVAVNERLVEEPALLKDHPEGEGWLYRLKDINETEWNRCSQS